MKYSPLFIIILLLSLTLVFSTSVLAQKDDKFLIKAKKLHDKKKYDEAVEAYKKSFQINPNWKAAYGIGNDYLRTENFAEAIVHFRKALELKADESIIWYSIGYSYAKLNENEQAISALQQAVKLNPNYTDAWYNLGSVLFKSERYREAIEAYTINVKLNPNDAEAYAFLGLAYSNLNNYQQAVESLQKALKIAPHNNGYRQNLTMLETKLKEQRLKTQ